MNPTTLINGQAYSFVDVTFDFGGLIAVPGFNGVPIKSISYNVNQQTTANYENSKYTTSYSYGKMTYTGSVTFTSDSAELMRDAIYLLGVRERSIAACPAANLTLTFSNRGKINTTTIHNLKFTTENLSASEGDDTLQVTCDFIASFVDFGGISATTSVIATVINGGLDVINQGDNQGI